MDPAVVAAAGSGAGYGIANFLGGLASRRSPVLLVLLCSQTAALAAVTAAAVLASGRPHDRDLLVGAGAGLLAATGAGLAYRCFSAARIGVSAVVLGTTQLAVPAVAAAVSGQPRGTGTTGGLLLAATAVVVLGWPAAGERTGLRAVMLAVAAGAAFGGYHVLMSATSGGSGVWPVVAAETAIVIVAGAALLVRRPAARPRQLIGQGLAVADGLASSAATLAALAAVRGTALPTAGGLIALLPAATTVLLARLALQERLRQRARAGLSLAAVAIVVLARGRTR
jgi:drug/metabolite transporter (DMT)-like permease